VSEGNTPAPENKPEPVFKQEDVNRIVAEERRKLEGKTKQIVSQLEELRAAQGTTAQQKEELERRIEELSSTFQTKEQQIAAQSKKEREQYEATVKSFEGQAKTWRSRYEESTIERALLDAATQTEAFNPTQIVKMLRSDTRLAEELDDKGQPTGNYVVKVKHSKEGKVLELSAAEALKALKESDGNLFKNSATGGIGASPRGKPGQVDPRNLSPADYRAMRKSFQ
jgi:TolA-binding protein